MLVAWMVRTSLTAKVPGTLQSMITAIEMNNHEVPEF